jgi:hypothetical protein
MFHVMAGLHSQPAVASSAGLGREAGFLSRRLRCTLLGTAIFAVGLIHAELRALLPRRGPDRHGLQAVGQHYRFAAAEVAPPEQRSQRDRPGDGCRGDLGDPRAGDGQALQGLGDAGPVPRHLHRAGRVASDLDGWTIAKVSRLRRVSAPTPIFALVTRPSFIAAAIAGLVAYGTMNLIMAATPLQMKLCGFGVNDSTDVIRAHAICMFAPGFISGRLIDRYGPHRVILVGGVLNFLCIAIALSGSEFSTFIVALMALGVGWNFMFVGASALLTTAHSAAERVRAQATNDFIVFGMVAIDRASARARYAAAGWIAV